MSKPVFPLRVYSGKLRPQFPTKIIEVLDANGRIVIKWTGLEADEFSHTELLATMKKIVRAANKQESEHGK